MRHTIKNHVLHVETKNPATLYSKDLQAFAVTREYLQAIRTHQAGKASKIREANVDLLPYLNFIDGAFLKNPYYEV